MQTTSLGIWTQIVEPISDDCKDYATRFTLQSIY